METTNEYDKQAQEFLTKTNTSYKCTYLKYDKHFITDDEQPRNIYRITLERNGKKYTTNFGDALINVKISTIKPYDFLACLQKYPINNIDEFARDFDTLNTKLSEINRAYKACVREYTALKSLYSEDELELLRAIC